MMTTLFLMKIGKEYFFKLVRFFSLSVFLMWCERSPIGGKAMDRILLIIGCWLSLADPSFFVFPVDRPINFPEKVCLFCCV